MGLFDKINKKYNIDPEENVPQKVYGPPRPDDSVSKYDIKPENNVPQRVYGPPRPDDSVSKYDIKPENNVPQRVYGPPRLDGNISKYDTKPEDNVPQIVYGVMEHQIDLDKRNKESISVIINNYCLSITKWGDTCDLLFMDKTKESFVKDSIISISLEKFERFVNKINAIVSSWENEYSGGKEIKWQIKFNTKDINKTIIGNGEYPSNWNEFVDLLSEYEILFKETVDCGKEKMKTNLTQSLEELINEKVNDPFWEKLIFDYLKQEINKSETALKLIFKDLSKYDDIFNEFTKYIVQKNYDIPGAISIEGYTAKNIAQLNPSFKATGVYTFLNYLREKPEDAKDIIKKGFPNKDVTPPMISKEYYLKLVHTPFHGCYGTLEELEKQKVNPIVSYHKIEKGKSLLLDRITVIVDDFTNEIVNLTIPYQPGIIVNQDDYIKQSSSKIMLKIGEKYTLYLDVCDAMESWEISFIDKKDDDNKNINLTDKEIEKFLKEIEPEVDSKMIEMGLLKIENGKKIPVFGSCHTAWAIEKQLLKERYNIDWQTPAEKNPFINYD